NHDTRVVIDTAFTAFMQDDGALPYGLGLNDSLRDGAERHVFGTCAGVADGIAVDVPDVVGGKAGSRCMVACGCVAAWFSCRAFFVGDAFDTSLLEAQRRLPAARTQVFARAYDALVHVVAHGILFVARFGVLRSAFDALMIEARRLVA